MIGVPKKNNFIFCFLLVNFFFSLTADCQSPNLQNIYGRSNVSLNGRWNYIIDPYEMGYYDYRHMPFDESPSGKGGFYDDRKPANKGEWVEYDFDLSTTLKIPGDWNSQAEKLSLYEGTIWLRRKFNTDVKNDKKYFLYFGAVNYEAHVYLNGKKLGIHKGGFTPFQFEVTGKLKQGENFVVVKADNRRYPDEIPTVNTDWWNYGGITRDVLLAEVPVTYIEDYKVQLAKGDLNKIEGFVQLSGTDKIQKITINIPPKWFASCCIREGVSDANRIHSDIRRARVCLGTYPGITMTRRRRQI